MTETQKRDYYNKVARLRAVLVDKYVKQVDKLIIAEFRAFANDIGNNGVSAAKSRLGLRAWNEGMMRIFESMYKETTILFGNATYRSIKIQANQKSGSFGFNQQWTNDILLFLARNGFKLVNGINQTTIDKLIQIATNGIEDGLGNDAIVKLIMSDETFGYSRMRAKRIVQTEVMRASNIGAIKGAEAHKFMVNKIWISAKDSRTRRIPQDQYDHVEMDGVTIALEDPFLSKSKEGVEFYAMQPGDLGSEEYGITPKGFTINCRCTIGFIPLRDANGKLIPKRSANNPLEPNIAPLNQAVQMVRERVATNNVEAFVEAKTIKDAEKYAIDKIGLKYVSYKGFDVNVANVMNRVYYTTKKALPNITINGTGSAQASNKELKQYISDGFKTTNKYQDILNKYGEKQAEQFLKDLSNRYVSNVGKDTLAFSRNRKEITFSDGTKLDLSKFMGVYLNDKHKNEFSKLNYMGAKNVESGWFVEGSGDFRQIMVHEVGHEIDNGIDFKNDPKFKEIFAYEHKQGINSVSSELSRYGATAGGLNAHKDVEMIAESWTEYVTSPNPRRLSNEIGELMLRGYYDKYKDSINEQYDDWFNAIIQILRG